MLCCRGLHQALHVCAPCRHSTIKVLARKAYDWRLRAVPYHYTAFHNAHLNGCPVMRPLFFSWPSESASFLIDQQWMLGDALMIAPILLEGTDTVPAYFPAGTWYNLYNHISIDTSAAAQNLSVSVSVLHMLPLFAKQHFLAALRSRSPGAPFMLVCCAAKRYMRSFCPIFTETGSDPGTC